MKPKILVHVCCAPDGLYVFDLLKQEYDVYGFFYNPNIHPHQEYKKRLEETRKVAISLDVPLFEGDYDAERWIKMTKKFSSEPEKGKRCDICYAIRLEQTARHATKFQMETYTTVMSLSPWKKASVLNRIGQMFAARWGGKFLIADFKKKDGFAQSVKKSRELGLYRQNYCGCLYSRRGKQENGGNTQSP